MNEINIFSLVPVEVLQDRRLTLWQIRVLIALLSFRAKNTDQVWPKREHLAKRCGGMHLSNLSKTTSELVDLGWLIKDGDGGRSRAARYKITVPDFLSEETVAESATVADSATVVDSANKKPKTVADSTTETVANSARGKEHTKEQTRKSNIPFPPSSPSPLKLLEQAGVSMQVAADWLEVRAQKKLPLTQTALAGIQREADKAKITVEEAITVCCEMGWAGFKADWLKAKGGSRAEDGDEARERARKRLFGGQNAGI